MKKIGTDNPADILTKSVLARKFMHCLDLLNIGRRRLPRGAFGSNRILAVSFCVSDGIQSRRRCVEIS